MKEEKRNEWCMAHWLGNLGWRYDWPVGKQCLSNTTGRPLGIITVKSPDLIRDIAAVFFKTMATEKKKNRRRKVKSEIWQHVLFVTVIPFLSLSLSPSLSLSLSLPLSLSLSIMYLNHICTGKMKWLDSIPSINFLLGLLYLFFLLQMFVRRAVTLVEWEVKINGPSCKVRFFIRKKYITPFMLNTK